MTDGRLSAAFPASGSHAERPLGSAGPTPALYPCTEHGWERWDGVAWTALNLPNGAISLNQLIDVTVGGATDGQVLAFNATTGEWVPSSPAAPEVLLVAVSDETTTITTGLAKTTFRMPFAMTLTGVRASLTTASTSGIPTVDINEAGVSILSTKLTIDATEKTSTTAATAAVISDTALADDAEITIDVDVAGTGAKGLKVALIGTRA